MSWSTPFHRPTKGKDLLVVSQMMCARAFHNFKFNQRADPVTTWRDPQVSLFFILYFDFSEMDVLQFGFQSASKVISSIIDLFLL